MKTFVVTAKMGDNYYDSVGIQESSAYNAIVDGCRILGCSYSDVVGVVMVHNDED